MIDSKGGVAVRAERSGKGNGRVYTLWFTASDGRGGSCDGSVQVCVPRDKHHVACVDDGQNFNSLGPCPGGHGNDRDAAAVTLTVGVPTGNLNPLEYSLSAASDVSLAVYDVAGRRVVTLEHSPQSAGTQAVSWNTTGIARGMYFYRLQGGSVTVTKSILILN